MEEKNIFILLLNQLLIMLELMKGIGLTLHLNVLKIFLLATKKPPEILPELVCGFSLNSVTRLSLSLSSPNLPGGLTPVTVRLDQAKDGHGPPVRPVLVR